MSTIQSTIRVNDGVSSALKSMNRSMRMVLSSFESMQHASSNPIDTAAIRSAITELNQVDAALHGVDDEISRVITESNRLGSGFNTANGGANRLLGTVRNLASAFVGLQGVQKLVSLSDSMSSTTARLDLMNDGSQSTDDLQKKIYQSAQASRASYLDTAAAVSKMGLNAGNAFNSNDELIAFMEQVNKNFVIGGASAAEQSNAMLQLTQAMGAGALRGEELNSILESGPLIARNIEKYMGWASGSIKRYAEQGAVTAQVVKNAMLAMSNETNEKFNSMDLTWAQVMTNIQNRALMASQPVLDIINLMAQNWSTIEPIAVAAGTGILFFASTTWIASGGVGTLAGAVSALWAALSKNPLLLIGSLILGGIVYGIYQWVQSCGSLDAAWATAMYNVQRVTIDVMNSVLSTVQEKVNGAIKLLNMFIRGANMIPGVEIGEIAYKDFADTISAKGELALSAAKTKMDGARAAAIDRNASGIDYNALTLAAIKDSAIKTAKNTGSTLDTLNRSLEDMEYLKDLATQRSINQFTTAEIKVDMSGMVNQISNDMDLDGVVQYLAETLEEELLIAAEGSHY